MRKALLRGSLGDLNPFPWAMMTGNCLGWVVYAYYLDPHDPFLVAANLPGLILSIWLNSGAAKLQYQDLLDLKRLENDRLSNQEGWDASPSGNGIDEEEIVGLNDAAVAERRRRRGGGGGQQDTQGQRRAPHLQFHPEHLVTVNQERTLLRVLLFWTVVLVYVGWIGRPQDAAPTIGMVVNLNLIFFYGAPLKVMKRIIMDDRNSNTIHRPTMYMNWANTSFWIGYGLAKMDFYIVVPNATGLSLGLAQGLLCLIYPRTSAAAAASTRQQQQQQRNEAVPLNNGDENNAQPADGSATTTDDTAAAAKKETTKKETTESGETVTE